MKDAAINLDEGARIARVSRSGRNLSKRSRRGARRFLFQGARADFYSDLAVHLEQDSRLPIALTKVYETYTRRGTPWYWQMLGLPAAPAAMFASDLLYRHTEAGDRFPVIVNDWLPSMEAQLFTTIQASGLTAESLDLLAEKAVSSAKTSMTMYTAFLPIGGLVLGLMYLMYYLATDVLADFIQDPNAELVGQAAVAKTIGDFITAFGIPISVLIVAGFAGILWSFPNWTGKWRRRADNLFPYSIWRDYTSAMWLISLGVLLRSEVREQETHEELIKTADPYIRERLSAVHKIDDQRLAFALDATGFNWPPHQIRAGLETAMSSDTPGQNVLKLATRASARLNTKLNIILGITASLGNGAIGAILYWLIFVTKDLGSTAGQ